MDKHFEQYSIEELAEDTSFQSWVLNQEGTDAGKWEAFFQQHPDKLPAMKEAKLMVETIGNYFEKAEVGTPQLHQDFNQLLQHVSKTEKTKVRPIFAYRKLAKIAAAAVVLLALGAGLWVWDANQLQQFSTGYGEWKTVELPDGSKVRLNSNSSIQLTNSWGVSGSPTGMAYRRSLF